MNRKLAIENGLNKFQHKNGCKHCGSKERYVSSYTCVSCTLKKLDDPKLMNPYRTPEKSRKKLNRWRKNNPEKVKAQDLRRKDKQQAYYEEHKDMWRTKQLQKDYGISLEQYDKMLIEQNNKCAICKSEQCTTGKSFSVDHNHITGKVRGLLCRRCNMGLGHFEGNMEAVTNMLTYMKKNKCESL